MDKRHTDSLEAPLFFVLNKLCVLCIQSSGMNAITRILRSDRRELDVTALAFQVPSITSPWLMEQLSETHIVRAVTWLTSKLMSTDQC